MVLYGLTVIVVNSTQSNTAVSLLILSFLVPAVVFSAVAGVYVDRIDRRLILIATNILRGASFVALYLVGTNLPLILVLNVAVSTITVFFAPAEAAMIPVLLPRSQLLAANGIFTLTLNAAFALGFALLGPLVVNVASPEAVILVVAACTSWPRCSASPSRRRRRPTVPRTAWVRRWSARRSGPSARRSPSSARAWTSSDRTGSIGWSLLYLGITASLVGRARRPRPGLRPVGARSRRQGLRGRRAAARVRHRDRHPAAQRLRSLPAAAAGHRGRPDRARRAARGAGHGRPDQPPAPARRRAGRLRPERGHLAPGGGRGDRLLRRDRLRPRRDPVADAAPGGPARGRPRPRLRGAQHAGLGRQLPADHRRRADLRPDRHDRGDRRRRDRGPGRRAGLRADARPAAGDRRPAGRRPARGRPDRGGARCRPGELERAGRLGDARRRGAAPGIGRRPTASPAGRGALDRSGPSDPTDRD